MKIQFKNLTSSCILFALANLVACSDDMDEGHTPVQPGNIVRFAAYSPATRTIYDDENIFQINWEAGDNIKIYGSKDYNNLSNADYAVTPVETDGENTNKLYSTGTIAASGTSQLMWADNNEHKFIGVYPNDNSGISVDMANDVVTLPINRNQRCQLVTIADNNYYKQKYSNYTYYAKPDMKNAYLVAYNALTPAQAVESAGDVFLNFKPVMTAIEVVVKSRVNSQPVQVTGISISRIFPVSNVSKDSFTWNAKEAKMVYSETGTATNITKESTMVSLDTDDNLDYVTLQSGQSIVFTVFLPPFPVNATYPIQVRAHATGSVEVVTKNITNEILAGNKRRITLPNFPETDNGNNWITPLDGNIYVSQLSIPGSHDAATGEEMADIVGTLLGTTQDNTLQTQWDLGIRCFDLRPAIYTYNNNGWPQYNENDDELFIYHGATRVNLSWANAMNSIKANLSSHPGEFAIVLFRHEDDKIAGLPLSKNTNTTDFDNMMKNWVNQNKQHIVDWKPDLTIDEARGKIILLSRFAGTWECGAFTGWSHDEWNDTYIPPLHTINNYNSSVTGNIYVQDDYTFSNHDIKYKDIIRLLDITADFHTNETHKNIWALNHVSGYAGSISTTGGYRDNAAAQNLKIYEYLQQRTGTTGIILFDYAGIKMSSGTNVNGDVILQAVINNNYKYRMKRKGE